MNEILADAFRHSAWATQTLLDACRPLTTEQRTRPGRAYGSIVATLNHVVGCDADYAAQLGAPHPAWLREGNDTDDLDQLAAWAAETASAWERLLAGPLDAERMLVLDDGRYEVRAGVVVAQALQHASAHREQVRAALKEMGAKPPDLQPWAYGDATGRGRFRDAT